MTPPRKTTHGSRDGSVGKGLPCKCEDLSSNPQNPHKTRHGQEASLIPELL